MTDLVCYCARVSREEIEQAIAEGATTLVDIQQMTGAGVGSQCKELNPKGVCCHSDIRAILRDELGAVEPAKSQGCGCGDSCCGG